MHYVETYSRIHGFTVRRLASPIAIVRAWLLRAFRGITVPPVSQEWCERHMRDSAKR